MSFQYLMGYTTMATFLLKKICIFLIEFGGFNLISYENIIISDKFYQLINTCLSIILKENCY